MHRVPLAFDSQISKFSNTSEKPRTPNRARRAPVLAVFHRKAALHVMAGTSFRRRSTALANSGQSFQGFGSAAGCRAHRLTGRHRTACQPCGQILARHKAIGPPQKLQVIIVKDMRLALKIELGQGKRPAFTTRPPAAPSSGNSFVVRDPDLLEIAVQRGPVRCSSIAERVCRVSTTIDFQGAVSGHGNATAEPDHPLELPV